jgi:hypothetical protein
MDPIWQRMADNLLERVSGPMHFRVFMQPMMAIFFGIRDGLQDARNGQPAYFWSIFAKTRRRRELILNGLRAVAKIMILAVALDAVYQIIELHWFYPGEAILVALLLGFIPYLLVRGPANRIARRWFARRSLEVAKYGTPR